MYFFPIDHTFWIIHNSYFQLDLEKIHIFLSAFQKIFNSPSAKCFDEARSKIFILFNGAMQSSKTCLSAYQLKCPLVLEKYRAGILS